MVQFFSIANNQLTTQLFVITREGFQMCYWEILQAWSHCGASSPFCRKLSGELGTLWWRGRSLIDEVHVPFQIIPDSGNHARHSFCLLWKTALAVLTKISRSKECSQARIWNEMCPPVDAHILEMLHQYTEMFPHEQQGAGRNAVRIDI